MTVIWQVIWNILAFVIAGAALTAFDCLGYGVLVQTASTAPAPRHQGNIVPAYRKMQLMFQFTLYGLFVSLHLWGGLFAFMAAHWFFAYDVAYYLVRGERFNTYEIIWFKSSAPSIYYRLAGRTFWGVFAVNWAVVGVLLGLALCIVTPYVL